MIALPPALRFSLVVLILASLLACAEAEETPPPETSATACPSFPRWTYDEAHVWPADQSLARPEDGAVLPDGRILVSDEAHGLRVIETDGSHRPFGRFAEAGYTHQPPDFPGGASAVLLENDGAHVVVGDVYTGRLYRVHLESEATTMIYDHPYGVNEIDQDRSGTLWFTQSTTNTEEQGMGGIFADLNQPVPTGAVYTLTPEGNGYAATAETVIDSLYFANGLALDNAETTLYVSEMMTNRVLRYRLDVADRAVSGRDVYHLIGTPDNLAVDADDNLWIASPIENAVVVVDARCGSAHTVFRAPSASNTAVADAWGTRSHLGEPRLDLLTPDAFAPLPGFLTGMFWSPGRETLYFTGLGDAVMRYPAP